ncbi:hypothetical protein U27_05100 [Candidatus Vecturithrix granuli]|uniref:Uncharacterized protein n=1 Tax=Vecturithrix granuli TaxID=1499967 RepID=A0A081C0M2_VECG1|nr:hypothetical protein U27_05100 [Candidatus Vecturithrix granuli]
MIFPSPLDMVRSLHGKHANRIHCLIRFQKDMDRKKYLKGVGFLEFLLLLCANRCKYFSEGREESSADDSKKKDRYDVYLT